jgi:hypothetical protein
MRVWPGERLAWGMKVVVLRPHVMLLDLLANYGVVNAEEDPAKGIRFRFEVKPARDVDRDVDVGDPNRIPDWRDREILIARPQLDQAYLSIMATLQRHALIAQSRYRSSAWAATDLGLVQKWIKICDDHRVGRGDLTNEQWSRLEPLLPVRIKPGRPPVWSKRQLIDGIRWRTRTGAPWRDVPARYSKWETVYDCSSVGNGMARGLVW